MESRDADEYEPISESATAWERNDGRVPYAP
jgi:hypothetical protein